MELTNDFRVGVPVERAWEVLTDLERIAPCLPGAQLQEVEGDEYRGTVKVKVGPITAQYKGTAAFVERDETAHKAVLKATGRETRGQGNASATITADLRPDGDGTAVTIITDLTITGRVAQFGRGVMADVSSALLGQFVEQLEQEVLGEGGADGPSASTVVTENPTEAADTASASAAGGVRQIAQREVEPIDLLQSAGNPVAKRLVPLVAGLGLLGLIILLLRRRRSS